MLKTTPPAEPTPDVALTQVKHRRRPLLWVLAALLITALWTVNAYTGQVEMTWTLDNILAVATGSLYRTVTLRTLGIAILVTVIDVIIAVPIAFTMAQITRTARWEAFDSPARMAASVVGGLLMGFGGVLAVGCSIGQGLSGLSTLAFASVPAVIGIVVGALATLKIQTTISA